MVPTLRPDDHLLVDPAAYRIDTPARDEIVVLRDPESRGRLLVKRVAGVPGDPTGTGSVPVDSVFVLGDSRESSRDSRAFGPVAVSALVGRAWFRYRPADRRGPLDPRIVK
jgi:signal peptidase I